MGQVDKSKLHTLQSNCLAGILFLLWLLAVAIVVVVAIACGELTPWRALQSEQDICKSQSNRAQLFSSSQQQDNWQITNLAALSDTFFLSYVFSRVAQCRYGWRDKETDRVFERDSATDKGLIAPNWSSVLSASMCRQSGCVCLWVCACVGRQIN